MCNIKMEKTTFHTDIKKVFSDFAASPMNNELNINVILINEV